ncbi:MAG TPA: hypothetical protein PK867_01770 [Pirellulales bacterium]|nr:hypothetical protein [Pirellulales bacterium]
MAGAEPGEVEAGTPFISAARRCPGLRREVGPEGDVMAAYRRWYWQQMEEHDQGMFRVLQRLDEAWKEDGR